MLLCQVLLSPLVVALVGAQFAGAAALFADASWLLIPLLLIHSFVQGRANTLITNLDEVAADLFAKGRAQEVADAG